MTSVLRSLLLTFRTAARARAALQLEILALRHLYSANIRHEQNSARNHAAIGSEPVLVMETGEKGFRHDPMAVRQVVIDRP